MLTITAAQFAALDQAQRDTFVLRLQTFLHEEGLLNEPDPEDPFAATDRLVMWAEERGIASELGITYFAILASQFGESMQTIADRPWFAVLQRDEEEVIDPDWIERVFHTVIECLHLEQPA